LADAVLLPHHRLEHLEQIGNLFDVEPIIYIYVRNDKGRSGALASGEAKALKIVVVI
jgi:hypothetical protein